ncbi:transcription factor PacC [Pseudohyphozyma bogoriensis]|nr:transcription factor PacC [Pseudohyphozyma bogoriensis]
MSKANDGQHRCQWGPCELVFDDAETLYEHITGTHIGRKSAGTLSLECHWAGCTSKATKRDHLTSHARVHIDLKPHSCPICSKSFKRPQDLKKHEKIHTEEHHAHHKHSKAVTVGGGGDSAAATANSRTATSPPAPNVAGMAGAYPGFPYPAYPFFGQHPMFSHPGAMSQLDVAQFIEHQRQLNAHVVNSAYSMQGMPGMQAFGLPGFPAPGTFPGAPHAAQLGQLPMFNPQMPGYGFPYFHPGTGHPLQLPPISGVPGVSAAPGTSTSPATSPSLYPTLPPLGTPFPPAAPAATAAKTDDGSSPAGASPHQAYSPASTLSPKAVPSLSPASNTNSYSPSPEHDSDISLFRRASPANGAASSGQKRAFDDGVSEFFHDVKNKRFAEDDFSRQVESIDALSLLLTPNDFSAPTLSSVHSQEHSSESSTPAAPVYTRQDVDHMNSLLADLAQNLDQYDSQPAAHPPAYYPANPSVGHATSGSMYPSLGGFDRPLAPLPSRTVYNSYPDAASVRLSKSTQAPSIVPNETRLPAFHHIERLTRAAPMPLRDRIRMQEQDGGKGYSTSLRSTSLDTTTSESDSHSPSPIPDKLAPLLSAAASASQRETGPTLPPIQQSTSQPAPVTSLPSIRDMLKMKPASPSPEPSSRSSSSMYPSISVSPPPSRPGSSAGPMERLVPHFTRMRIPCDEDEKPVLAHEHDDESDLDDGAENHPKRPKKSRFDSPEPMDVEEKERSTIMSEAKARRLATIRALIFHVNDTYRRQHIAAMQAAEKEKK